MPRRPRRDARAIILRPQRGARISVVATGGTIGSAPDEHASLAPVDDGAMALRAVIRRRRQLALALTVRVRRVASLLSEDVHPSDWIAIASAVAAEIATDPPPDGIVVTHGTDTLAFTATAVAFLLEGVPVPVVFTGALFPPDDPRSDAVCNVTASVRMAANTELAGVFVVFGDGGHDACRVTPAVQTTSIPSYGRAFGAVDPSLCGRIDGRRIRISASLHARLPPRTPRHTVDAVMRLDDRVKLVAVHPALRPRDVLAVAEHDCRAIVLRLYHSGTASTRDGGTDARSLVPAIAECTARGILVFGHPSDGGAVYRSTRLLADAGLLLLPKMSLEATLVKLMWLLARHDDARQVAALMRSDLRGEIAGSLSSSV